MESKKQSNLSRLRSTFPYRLHCLLSNAAELGVDNIITWHPSGEKFVIFRQEQFVEKILPNIFKQTKFASFRRQINAYGFKKEVCVDTLNPSMVYSHKHFQRDNPTECNKIIRQRPNNTIRKVIQQEEKFGLGVMNQAYSNVQRHPYQIKSNSDAETLRKLVSTNFDRGQPPSSSLLISNRIQHPPRKIMDSPAAIGRLDVDFRQEANQFGINPGQVLKKLISSDSTVPNAPSSAEPFNRKALISTSTDILLEEKGRTKKRLGVSSEAAKLMRNSWKQNILASLGLVGTQTDPVRRNVKTPNENVTAQIEPDKLLSFFDDNQEGSNFD